MTSDVMSAPRRIWHHADMDAQFGSLLRHWRTTRRLTQESLAVEAEVSARHLSYLENSRSQPSREMVLVLASVLEIPLRERNLLLLSAGFAPAYGEADYHSADMAHVRHAVEFLLARHEPHPAIAVDVLWNVRTMNQAAKRLFGTMIDPCPELPQLMHNAARLLLHPTALRPYVGNWEEIAAHLIDRLRREAASHRPRETRALLDELATFPGVPRRVLEPTPKGRLLLPMHLQKGGLALSFFTTITTLGTPLDVTAQELRIEAYFPADATTAQWLAGG
jgi:transcriptional regulator with XRE-family HTH domain